MFNMLFDTAGSVEAAFYKAFSSFDLGLMTEVWTDSNKACCIHPGSGLLKGKTSVMASWMKIFSGGEPPVIEHRFIQGFTDENLVVHLVEERIRPRDKASAAANRILVTNIYVQEEGSWRLAEHHASLPLVERETPTSEQRRLH